MYDKMIELNDTDLESVAGGGASASVWGSVTASANGAHAAVSLTRGITSTVASSAGPISAAIAAGVFAGISAAY